MHDLVINPRLVQCDKKVNFGGVVRTETQMRLNMRPNLKVILSSLGVAAVMVSPVLAKSHHVTTVHAPSGPQTPTPPAQHDFQDQAGRGGLYKANKPSVKRSSDR